MDSRFDLLHMVHPKYVHELKEFYTWIDIKIHSSNTWLHLLHASFMSRIWSFHWQYISRGCAFCSLMPHVTSGDRFTTTKKKTYSDLHDFGDFHLLLHNFVQSSWLLDGLLPHYIDSSKYSLCWIGLVSLQALWDWLLGSWFSLFWVPAGSVMLEN